MGLALRLGLSINLSGQGVFMFSRTTICTAALLAMGSGVLVVPVSALAQEDGTQAAQRVEVIGSSIKRTEAATDAPIQTLSREDIAKTGATSVEELMRHITANNSSNSTVAASASGATTGGISTISLRGLGPQHTLILINGQRSAPYGDPVDSVSVDLDSIPVAAIERVEVLKEGAGAIYGSDAVAGVVNFVLRKNFSGTEMSAYYGRSYDNKGDITRASLLQGFNSDKANLTMLITAEHDDPLYGRDRPFANTSIFPQHDNFSASSGSDPANFSIGGLSQRFNPGVPVSFDATAGKFVPSAAGSCGPNSVYNATFSSTGCLFDVGPYVSLVPDIDKAGLVLTGHYDVSDDTRLHADFSITNKSSYTQIQPSPIGAYVGIPFTLTTASPYYPTAFVTGITSAATAAGVYSGSATPDLTLRYRPFITGQRGLTDNATNMRVSAGADTSFLGWDTSANLLYSTSDVTENLKSGYFRINGGAASGGPGIEALLNGQTTDANGNTLWVNPFGANSADVMAAAMATNFIGTAFHTSTSLLDGQLKVSKDDLVKLDAGNVGAAFGLDVRRDTYTLNSAAALSTGDISGYGGNFSPFTRARPVTSIFGELDVPVVKGLDVDGAVRYDRYGATTNPNTVSSGTNTLSSISTTDLAGDPVTIPSGTIANIAQQGTVNASSFGQATGKLGAKWQINKDYVVRATVSSGFRAPSLLDLYAPLQSGVSAVLNDPARCNAEGGQGADCATQFNIYTGGNGGLKPEKSTTFTLGGVMSPVKDVNAALDYYKTKLRNEIAVLPVDYILSHEAQYPGVVIRAAGDAVNPNAGPIIAIDQRNLNIAEADVSGIDFDFSAALNTSAGRFGFAIGGSYQLKWDSINPDGSRESEIGKTSSTVTGMIPRLKLANQLSYRAPGGQFEGTVIYNWQSGGTDICGSLDQDDLGNCAPGIAPPHVRSYGTTDLQVKWDPIKMFSATVGVKNAFNTTPPYVNGAGGAFQSGYDPTYVDPRGRFWYVSGTVRF
jgi:iron complex outermembrane receptor protein